MNRLRLNAVSPTRDDAMSGQKSPRKKALTRTVRIAPALGVSTLAVLLILSLGPDRSHGQTIGDTQITLSCNDGHSVIFEVDQITLTSLLADVQAINASGFFFQAEDGIRDYKVTGVQTCALPICLKHREKSAGQHDVLD